MPTDIKISIGDLIAQVASELDAVGLGSSADPERGVTTVSLGGYTIVSLWADRGLKFSIRLDDRNWDTEHEATHLEHARAAVDRAVGTVVRRMLGVSEVEVEPPGRATR